MRYDLYKVIREIHRRSVWQVLGVYLAMSWGASSRWTSSQGSPGSRSGRP